MEDNENQELKEENNEKVYTQAEVDEIRNQMNQEFEKTFDGKFDKRWKNEKKKIERDNAETNELVELLKQQTGKKTTKELLELSYEQYGVEKPSNDGLSEDDYTVLGKKDAKEFLDTDDYSEIEEEANRLANIPNRTAREQATFMELASYLTSKKTEQKRSKEIEESGIDKSVLQDAEFTEFLSKFREDTPIKDIYSMYEATHKKEKPFTTGSVKGTNVEDKNMVKDFYTEEEAKQFTKKDYDKNPALWKAVLDSMPQWYKK